MTGPADSALEASVVKTMAHGHPVSIHQVAMKILTIVVSLELLSRYGVQSFSPQTKGEMSKVTLKMTYPGVESEEEKAVLSTVRSLESSVSECLSAVDKLKREELPIHLIEELEGAWKVEWTDLGKSPLAKAFTKLVRPNLKMLSFGALPAVSVNLTASYQIFYTDNSCDLIQVFDNFAMRLRGPAATKTVDLPSRINVHFQSVQLLDLKKKQGPSLATLNLSTSELAIPKCRPTHIDIKYMTPTFRVHKGASGSTYVLTRHSAADLPFENNAPL